MEQQQQPPVRQNQNNNNHRPFVIPWVKLLLIGFLGGLALCLQVTVWTLQLHTDQARAALRSRGWSPKKAEPQTTTTDSDENDGPNETATRIQETIRSTNPTLRTELHRLFRDRSSYRTGASPQTAARAFWNQAVQQMDWDDPVVAGAFADGGQLWSSTKLSSSSSSSSLSSSSSMQQQQFELGVAALKRAAEAGHPTAQLYVANALAAGFWPWPLQQSGDRTILPSATERTVGSDADDDSSLGMAAWNNLQVQDDWVDLHSDQMNQAWLLWHMSAMAGNVEAALALANRMEFAAKEAASTATSSLLSRASELCEQRLPYLAAAAHGIVDLLQADPNSRGRVAPAKDKHLLYQVHLHGGTGSRLDMENRPDESPDALQYYHVRASDPTDSREAARAAYTLGRYYHFGLRGAPQNVTLALRYYVQAGYARHWEAAGQAGMMYLWGIGVKRDALAAHKLFLIGIPDGLEGCRNRFNRRLRQNKNTVAELALCENTCLTGMGLLHLLGVPMLAQIDHELATTYLKLAKDQGDVDAAYYLAMMKLGWKTHYHPADGMTEAGQAALLDEGLGEGDHYYMPNTKSAAPGSTHPTAAEYTSILSDLTTAASKGHLQALHRLAMMYETGVTIPNGKLKMEVVPRDCEKASKHYKTVVALGSPQRAVRMRTAYKQYMAGESSKSLRNYLAAAEAGSDIAMLNAAFLLEQGECLGLSCINCAKASVRLWKAAAAKGYGEASLRVGDFYYYGRFRDNGENNNVGPFRWVRYMLYPEELVRGLLGYVGDKIKSRLLWKQQEQQPVGMGQVDAEKSENDDDSSSSGGDVCRVEEGDADETCSRARGGGGGTNSADDAEHTIEKDLASAAHYYGLAAEKNQSPRAHFNLGFLYEWGLGLKQDFPLAKRHYDLAISTGPQEAEVPVTLALIALTVHEILVKKWIAWRDWLDEGTDEPSPSAEKEGDYDHHHTPIVGERNKGNGRRTRWHVFYEHALSGESLLILVLTIVVWILLQIRQRRTRR